MPSSDERLQRAAPRASRRGASSAACRAGPPDRMSTGWLPKSRILDDQLAVCGRVAHHRERAALALRRSPRSRSRLSRRNREHVALLRLVAPDLRGDMPGSSRRNRAQVERARRARAVCTSSGRAFDSPPAPTSWIERIGLASPSCQQRSITSCARRSISALPRCTESKSSSSVFAPAPMLTKPRRRRGRSACPGRRAGRAACRSCSACLVRCAAEMLPTPPASMIGLW